MENTIVALFGAGTMGTALTRGMLKSGVINVDRLRIFDTNITASHVLAASVDAPQSVRLTALEAISDADIVIVAVKPDHVEEVLRACSSAAKPKLLIISIAAGVPIDRLESVAPSEASVIRVMPNTPCLVSAGASALCRGKRVTDAEFHVALELFSTVGIALEVNESDMDAVTGLSGSGPAFVFLFIESMTQAGIKLGLTRDVAKRLATQTVLGAAKMAMESPEHISQLRDNVTSPGGTTIAGIVKLEQGGLRSTVIGAVEAAALRSKEISSLIRS